MGGKDRKDSAEARGHVREGDWISGHPLACTETRAVEVPVSEYMTLGSWKERAIQMLGLPCATGVTLCQFSNGAGIEPGAEALDILQAMERFGPAFLFRTEGTASHKAELSPGGGVSTAVSATV